MLGSNTQFDDSSAKSAQVLTQLRSQILEGRLPPGGRMPTFDEMTERFGVSRAVLQSAVAKLKRDGFVRSVNRQGLFVADKPPHLHRYGVVFPMHPEQPHWSRINLALVNEARKFERADPSQLFKIFTGLANETTGRTVHDTILNDIALHRLAGLILMPGTYHLIDEIRPRNPAFPLVSIFAPENWGFRMNVTVDRVMFYRKALKRLAELGRSRIAMIQMEGTITGIDYPALFTEAGLLFREHWLQVVGRNHGDSLQRLIALLLDYPKDQRPDGLILADDNLIERGAAGLAKTGIRVGEDISVVAHTNWPWPYSSVLPMDRLGYNATDILGRAIQTIRDYQEGMEIPCDQYIPAQFEWELPDGSNTVDL